MAITIVPKGQPIKCEALSCVILGNPGVGKTTLANTAEDPILLAFDLKGAKRSVGRPDTVEIHTWSDIENMTREDLSKYKTIIIDTIGRCIDVLAEDIMRADGKCGSGGQLSLRGYGVLKGRFRAWLNMINGYGLHVVMVAHATEERHGDEIRLRVDAAGSSKEEIYKEADLMGRMTIQGGKRIIDWNPSESGFGKNPAGIPTQPVPNAIENPKVMATMIRDTVDHLSQENVQSNEEEKRLTKLRDYIEVKLETAEQFTSFAHKMVETGAKNIDKAILLKAAKTRGYELDKKTLTFTDPNAPDPEPEAEEKDAGDLFVEGAESEEETF